MAAMTDAQAIERNARFPHIDLETVAYYEGRNAASAGTNECGFSDQKLRVSFNRGYRHIKAEDALSDDTEWDGDKI